MSQLKIRIATRNSPLAMWQAKHVAQRLESQNPNISTQLVPLKTRGDLFLKDKLQNIGGKGLFIKELETALLNNQADIAVHSMKDVPSTQPQGLIIAAICERENPGDAFVSSKYSNIAECPHDAIIGTSSLRREAQILAQYPKLKIKTLRGNVNTRLKKLDAGEYDGIILAASGLIRLELDQRIQQILPHQIMLPACGQGALGIECRVNDRQIIEQISLLNHADTEICVRSERYINKELGGSCHSPIGIYCVKIADDLLLTTKVLSKNGKRCIAASAQKAQSDLQNLYDKVLTQLNKQGVQQLLAKQ